MAVFDLPDLSSELRGLIAQIPPGRVATCGALAAALGNRIAARWVGHFSLHHDHDAGCPCHRVVRAGGQLGGYVAGAIGEKIAKLNKEGVTVEDDKIDMDRYGFDAFECDQPLETLRAVQEQMQPQIVLRGWRKMPKLVGGVDVAYPSPGEAQAAYAVCETETAALVWSTTIRRRVTFPYITSYLAFRELPVYLDLLEEVRRAGRLAEVLLVDGSGILHQRHAGVASHLGVAASVPTIGITKKLLCGRVDIEQMKQLESRPVLYQHQPIGVALRPGTASLRPIFVSPGHLVDLRFAEKIVRRLLTTHRLPEPLDWADRLSRG